MSIAKLRVLPSAPTTESDDELTQQAFDLNELLPMLPDILRKPVEVLSDRNSQMVFLLSSLGIMSGCLPNLEGQYNTKTYAPNLFFAVLGPAASCKGLIEDATKMGEKIEEFLQEEHSKACRLAEESKNTKAEKALEKRQNCSVEKVADKEVSVDPLTIAQPSYHETKEYIPSEEPNTPEIPSGLYLYGDTSRAALLKVLKERKGAGVLVFTEIDTLTQATRQDWGVLSDILRMSYEHETLTNSRIGSGDLRIVRPKVSCVLGGTPDQFTPLIPDSSNGLFSRVAVYHFEDTNPWRSARPTEATNKFRTYLNDARSVLFDVYLQLIERSRPIEFQLTDEQWDILDGTFQAAHDAAIGVGMDVSRGVFRRSAVGAFRMAMIFAAIRAHEANADLKKLEHLTPTDKDIQAACYLSLELAISSIRWAFNHMRQTKVSKVTVLDTYPQLFDALPQMFRRSDADATGTAIGICVKTVGNHLNRLTLDGAIEKVRHGQYRKLMEKLPPF